MITTNHQPMLGPFQSRSTEKFYLYKNSVPNTSTPSRLKRIKLNVLFYEEHWREEERWLMLFSIWTMSKIYYHNYCGLLFEPLFIALSGTPPENWSDSYLAHNGSLNDEGIYVYFHKYNDRCLDDSGNHGQRTGHYVASEKFHLWPTLLGHEIGHALWNTSDHNSSTLENLMHASPSPLYGYDLQVSQVLKLHGIDISQRQSNQVISNINSSTEFLEALIDSYNLQISIIFECSPPTRNKSESKAKGVGLRKVPQNKKLDSIVKFHDRLWSLSLPNDYNDILLGSFTKIGAKKLEKELFENWETIFRNYYN